MGLSTRMRLKRWTKEGEKSNSQGIIEHNGKIAGTAVRLLAVFTPKYHRRGVVGL